jgi:hypothetical protein
MPRPVWSDGAEVNHTDLSNIGARSERELYERVLFQMLQKVENAFFDDSFSVSRTNATTVSIAAGTGFQTDNTQVAPESTKRLIYRASAVSQALNAAHASLNRIDIICVRANRVTSDTATRKFQNAVTDAVTDQTFPIETDWQADISYTAGTPDASPAVPATPSGYIKVAELLITAVTGLASSSDITDRRTRFYTDNGNFEYVDYEELAANPSSPSAGKSRHFWKDGILYSKNSAGTVAQVNLGTDILTRNRYATADSPVAVTSNNHIIEVDLSGGSVVLNMPAVINGKPYRVKIIAIDGPNTNTCTINRNGSDTIEQDDATTGTSYVFNDLGRMESFYGDTTSNVWRRG